MSKNCRTISIVAMLWLSLPAGRAQELIDYNAAVAIVHDTVITRGDVMKFTQLVREALEDQYLRVPALYNPQLYNQKLKEALRDGLTRLSNAN